jgi:hypothetical protein
VVNRLESLAQATIEATTAASTDVAALRERAAARRRRRRTRFSALTIMIVLVVGLVGWRVLTRDTRRPKIAVPATQPATTQPVSALGDLPAPSNPVDQARVGLDRLGAPMAVADGKVWVANNAGVDVFDPSTLQRIATIPTALPVVTMAASTDGVWLITGDDTAGDKGASAPYTLLRIDLAGERVVSSNVLPFVDAGHRSSWNLRLAAGSGLAWVTFGNSVLEVDAASGRVTPISLQGRYIGNIAADRDGLWITTDGGDTPETSGWAVLHVDGSTGEETFVDGVQFGFIWSIAATDDAAWFLQSYVDPDGTSAMHLVRVDAATHTLTPFVVPSLAVVAGDGQVWVQLYKSSPDGLNQLSQLVGQFDPAAGKIVRTMRIFLGEVPGSSSDGYTFPPFAVVDGQVWSAYSGLQRTTIPSSAPSTQSATPIDLSTPLTTINSYYSALEAHDTDAALQTVALEFRPRWTPSTQVSNPDVTHLQTLTRVHIKPPQPIGPPESLATWPYSEWVGAWVTYRATYRANGVTRNGTQTKFLYLARAAGTTDWYIASIGPVP